ncbi:STAS domain-containing protein [Actinomadura sp. WMMA1423]|uniref:STAS domain-containing protein n=1 Tax=Actinomadura sp. WMMA1423 TaxID=2591108 RepID=UPI001146CCFB|nr:STAS domain-containing protein [Actinomadura sp. WMMA1423]
MTVWRITGGEGGPDPGAREGPRYDVVEHDSALLRITAASALPRVLIAGEVDVSNTAAVARALRAAQERVPGDGRQAGDAHGRPVGDAHGRPVGDVQGRPVGDAHGRPVGDVHADLSAVEFMDVAGLRAFTEAADALHGRGGLLVLHGVPPHIERLFTLIGWHSSPGLEIHCPPRR